MIFSNFIRALTQLVHLLIQAYILIIIVRSVISWMGTLPSNRFIYLLRRLTDPVFRFTHRMVPFSIIGGIDISPIIIIVALVFIDNVFTGLMMGYADKLSLGG